MNMATKAKSKESLEQRRKAHTEKLLHLKGEGLVEETKRRISRLASTLQKHLHR